MIQSFLVLLLTNFLLANSAMAIEFRNGNELEVSGSFKENLFVSGGKIQADIQSTDDVFIAGGEIFQTGGSTENMFLAGGKLILTKPQARMSVMAGGEIKIEQAAFHDLIVAGGEVEIFQSKIQDDLVAAANELEIGKGTTILGSALLNGNEVSFAGEASEDVQINAREVVVTGKIGKSLNVKADHLVIGPDAQIQGNFVHSSRSLEVAPSAAIQGRTEALADPKFSQGMWAFVAMALAFIGVSMLLSPAMATAVFPKFVSDARDLLQTRFWHAACLGVLMMIVIPIVLSALLFSLIGTAIGLAAIPFFMVAMFMAWAIVVFTAGIQLRSWLLSRNSNPKPLPTPGRLGNLGWSFAGAIALLTIMILPIIGFLFCTLLFFAGFGALFMKLSGATPRPLEVVSEPGANGLTPATS